MPKFKIQGFVKVPAGRCQREVIVEAETWDQAIEKAEREPVLFEVFPGDENAQTLSFRWNESMDTGIELVP